MTPATDWKEEIGADEDARFSRYAEQLVALSARRSQRAAPTRALHPKMNLGVVGEFSVLPGLPEHARIGLFGTPAKYAAYVRFSNGQGQIQPDRTPDVRGLAIKLVGVPGKKLIVGLEDAKTQDFLLIKSPNTPFRDADEFVTFALAAEKRALLLPRLVKALGFRRTLRILRQALPVLQDRTLSLATTPYYSAAAIQFGPYAVRVSLRPHATDASGAERGDAPDYLGRELAERLKGNSVGYDFCLQFYRDLQSTPIEDHAVTWRDEAAPPLHVATLALSKQDAESEHGRRLAQYIDTLSFDPWHAQDMFRPLGNVMRARNHAYRVSTQARKAAPEPDGSEEWTQSRP